MASSLTWNLGKKKMNDDLKFTNAGDYMNSYKKPPAPFWVNAFIAGVCLAAIAYVIWWSI